MSYPGRIVGDRAISCHPGTGAWRGEGQASGRLCRRPQKEGDAKIDSSQLSELKGIKVKRAKAVADTDDARINLANTNFPGTEFSKVTRVSRLTTQEPFVSEEKGGLSFIQPFVADAINGHTVFNQPNGVDFRKGSGVCLGFKPEPNNYYLAVFDVYDTSDGKQAFEVEVLGYSKSTVKDLIQGKIYVVFQAWNGNYHLLYVRGNVGEMWNFYNCELYEFGK